MAKFCFLSLAVTLLCSRQSFAQKGDYTKNLFINGDIVPPNDKVTAGSYCHYSGSANANTPTFVMRVNENDETFTHMSDSSLVQWECRLMSTEDFTAGNLVQAATSTPCAASTAFQRVQTTTPAAPTAIQTEQYRTHEIVLPDVDISAGAINNVDCGGRMLTAASVVYYAACKRSFTADSWSDVIVKYDFDPSECINTEISFGNINVQDPSDTSVTRRYDVTFDVYKSPTTRDLATLNSNFITSSLQQSPVGQKVGAPGVNLGDPIYLEACVAIADSRVYFVDGVSVMGVKLSNCVASPGDITHFGTLTNVPVSDTNGCGHGVSPAQQWGTSNYVFRYGLGGDINLKPYLQSPNCFRSEIFEAVSFARLNVNTLSKVVFTCDIDYCTSSTEGECFGTDAGGSNNYPTCNGVVGGKRRRRQVNQELDDLPQKASFEITIRLEDPTPANPSSDNCFDQTTFFSLLGVILGMTLFFTAGNVLLGTKLRKQQRAASSRTSSTTLSGY